MHHFVVKSSKPALPRATRGHWPSNQNPVDALGLDQLTTSTFAAERRRLQVVMRRRSIDISRPQGAQQQTRWEWDRH